MQNNKNDKHLSHDPTKSFVATVIDWSVHNQLLIGMMMIALLVAGIMAVKNTPLDAIPDMSDTQVIIRTEFSGQSPQIVEDLVTYPLSTTMLGLPKTKNVRGFSMFGTSFVYIIFEDAVDQYWARSRVIEALSKIQGDLPANVVPQIGPDATGVGWVYQYALIDKSGKHDLAELRSLQDWFLKFELATVSGVSEVASVGGFVKEYQVLIDPNRLRAFNIPIKRLMSAVRNSSMDAGGRVIEKAEMELIIRSKGYVTHIDQLKKIVLYALDGTPVQLSDVARVIEGPELRRGVTELNGEGEVVSGIVIMRSGENALHVIKGVKEKLQELQHGLPAGVEIISVYDRAPLIEGAVEYLKEKLIEEGIVVLLICLIFLLHVRSAFVAIITLPLGVLAAFIVMSAQGITANIMSLSGIAIAIGAMVDASVVMVENAHRKLSDLPKTASQADKNAAILLSTKEVGPGLFFSLLIITVSFMPVFALTGQSYRLFSPLAFTKTYAMGFAAILSITVVPVLMLWLIKGNIRKEEENPINLWFINLYKPLLNKALKYKFITLGIAVSLLISMVWPLAKIGSEFMPALYEGELLYMPTTMPGVSITKAKEILQQTNRMIKLVPEVHHVFGKVGRADTATDPAPISMIETWIRLKPKSEWRKGVDTEDLIKDLNTRVKIPGVVNSWGYPIKTRMDMISTGVRTPIGIKITGDDLDVIGRVALDIEASIKDIPGTRSAFADRVTGGKYLEIEPNRDELARRNIDLGIFQNIIGTALGGMKMSESIQGRERYNIMLRYDRPFREDPEDLSHILIPTPKGQHIPLGELASINFVEGPPMIKSENARLTGWVFVDIEGIDIGTYVQNAQKIVSEKVYLPTGYSIIWSGQFEQMLEAKARMEIAVPAAIFIIFTLLMFHFGRVDRTFVVMLSLPFGLIGGVWALYFAGYNFSVAVSVGFIALAGIAVETAVVMLLYIDHQVRAHQPKTKAELFDAVMHGAVLRVRPKLMTVCVILAGLTPIFITFGLGSDVMRRIALPMVGGMVSTTILTLIVIPVVYYIWEGRRYKNKSYI
ncbi:MAG: CusA/CzcA family heavy metal efflux RND transporter [Candidatus Endonucleobacter bathymodioli]|uniref:CusA/CzcA family heavy metal efflux RND transporter n=1 Tax=Candidatus Endonucleibacter bathymodioli TaxID=539814 RepID=A0AA90SXY1_9GAMM|nr:CusA/CzcA family heavy metal efflux RND transporter [Candidatus Endonucleobacter bathymodioli]